MSSTITPRGQQVQSNDNVVTDKGVNISWRDNYIRTKLYAHQNTNVDQSAYDALVVSLLCPSPKK